MRLSVFHKLWLAVRIREMAKANFEECFKELRDLILRQSQDKLKEEHD